MNRTELLEIIRTGENSGVEFKQDVEHADSLAKEMSALLNFEGGYILLGVDDDGDVTGLTRNRKEVELWVMNIAQNNIQPSVTPSWSSLTLDDGVDVGVIRLQADSPDKPYKAKRGNAWQTFVRVGSTSREAPREEERRLYQASYLMRHDIQPVLDTGFESLNRAARSVSPAAGPVRQHDGGTRVGRLGASMTPPWATSSPQAKCPGKRVRLRQCGRNAANERTGQTNCEFPSG